MCKVAESLHGQRYTHPPRLPTLFHVFIRILVHGRAQCLSHRRRALNVDGSKASARPWITVKYAQTLDGRIATRTGQSQWISGPEARRYAHRLRAEHDAVLVGIGTVIADDPQLTVRFFEGTDPVRIVLDTGLRTPLSAAILRSEPESTILAAAPGASHDRCLALRTVGATVLTVRASKAGIDLDDLLRHLVDRRIGSILVEGGATVVTSFLKRRLVDRMAVFIAPKIVGRGTDAIGELGIVSMESALTFARHSSTNLGSDLLFDGTIAWP